MTNFYEKASSETVGIGPQDPQGRADPERGIREFVVGVLLIPSGVTFLWFTIMGGAALHSELMGAGGLVEAVNEQGAPISLFALLAQYPAAAFTSRVTSTSPPVVQTWPSPTSCPPWRPPGRSAPTETP